MGISLCMIVRNEEAWVEGAVQSVRSIVNEVIIVDTGSTDATLERLKPLSINHAEACSCFDQAFGMTRLPGILLARAARSLESAMAR